jgi:CubicO group peptidase (beta-lactamase class C family)
MPGNAFAAKGIVGVALLAAAVWLAACTGADHRREPVAVVTEPAPYVWSQDQLAVARTYANAIGSAAVMIVDDGGTVAEWGETSRRLVSYSIRKSLISALFGIEAARGRIDPEATLADLAIDDTTPLSPGERSARVVDLLGARSGVYLPVDFESPRMQATRPARGSHAPGTFFYYNNWDFNALGTIFERGAGETIGAAFKRDIADAIGMQDFRVEDVYWLRGPISQHGAFHFAISTRDLARFGMLYRDGGLWRGRQVVPAEWVRRSTTSSGPIQYAGRPAGGYELLWWVADNGVHLPGLDLPGAFSARGAGGHYLLVIPERRLVIVHRGDNEPESYAIADVSAAALRPSVTEAQFAELVRLILLAQSRPEGID